MVEEQNKLRGISRVGDGLNLAEDVAEREHAALAAAPRYPDPTQPDVIVSIDIESLALGPRPIITEIAMLGYDLSEDSLLDARHVHHYPVEPQQKILPPREIHLGTLIARADWTTSRGIDFAQQLRLSSATEFEDLASLCRNFIVVFNQITNNGKANYEVVCARPQFDIVAIETLLAEVGLEKPWAYDSIIDVRTMLKRAGINHKNIPLPSGCTQHTGFGDARWQINQYLAAVRGVAQV
jgi:hypothetical protein